MVEISHQKNELDVKSRKDIAISLLSLRNYMSDSRQYFMHEKADTQPITKIDAAIAAIDAAIDHLQEDFCTEENS